jgi:hypothetical protein
MQEKTGSIFFLLFQHITFFDIVPFSFGTIIALQSCTAGKGCQEHAADLS